MLFWVGLCVGKIDYEKITTCHVDDIKLLLPFISRVLNYHTLTANKVHATPRTNEMKAKWNATALRILQECKAGILNHYLNFLNNLGLGFNTEGEIYKIDIVFSYGSTQWGKLYTAIENREEGKNEINLAKEKIDLIHPFETDRTEITSVIIKDSATDGQYLKIALNQANGKKRLCLLKRSIVNFYTY